MTRFKDFGTGGEKLTDPIVFKLHGEEFSCRPELQGKVLLDMVRKSADENNPAASAEVIDEFFSAVLLPESYARFDTLIKDPDKIVTVETLGEITGWLVEQYTNRPTTRPEDSQTGE